MVAAHKKSPEVLVALRGWILPMLSLRLNSGQAMIGSSYAHLTGVFKPKESKKSRRGVPIKGKYTTFEWAEEFEISEVQFRKWVSKYRIPFWKPGQKMYIDAEDFWRFAPYITHSDEKTGDEEE